MSLYVEARDRPHTDYHEELRQARSAAIDTYTYHYSVDEQVAAILCLRQKVHGGQESSKQTVKALDSVLLVVTYGVVHLCSSMFCCL